MLWKHWALRGRDIFIVMVVMATNASQEYQEAHLNKKQQMVSYRK